MDNSFLEILVDPSDGTPLQLDASQSALTSSSGVKYPLLKGEVPLLRVQQTQEAFNYQEHYEADAVAFDYFADWHPVHREENKRLHQHILKQIPAAAHTILDVGCGGAWLAKELVPQGKQVISMDISTTNPMRAVQLVPATLHHGLVADVYNLPIKEASVDCIIAAEIIEHVKDPALFMACLFKALKPNGTLIITTPFNETLQYSLCIHCNKRTPHHAHIHSFTAQTLADMAPIHARNVRTHIFNSKLLVNLKLHLLAKSLPFPLWRWLDKIFIKLTGNKALRLMMVLQK